MNNTPEGDTLKSIRELIDITRADFDVVKTIIMVGQGGDAPLTIKVSNLEHDVAVLQETLRRIETTINEEFKKSGDDAILTKVNFGKRLQTLERMAYMAVGAIAIVGTIASILKYYGVI